MFLVLHSQKLKQKQVIPSTMPGSFLFMFVTPRLSHVGFFQFCIFFKAWHEEPVCVFHIACPTSCSLEHLTWNIFKNEELQEHFYHFFLQCELVSLVKSIWIRWCCLSMMFYLFSCCHCTWFRIEVKSSAESESGQLTDYPLDVHQNTYVVMSLSI